MTVSDYFNPAGLTKVCEMEAADFAEHYDMVRVDVDQIAPHDFYLFADRGSRVLAVAHLDTVEADRTCHITDSNAGPVVFSGGLDDRLGAYVIAELLPAMGYEFDLLFTVGEEVGMSTAAHFDPAAHHDREYDWIIQFDRGGTDVVLYQYDCRDLRDRVESTGAEVNEGIFSDISYLGHVGVKAMNWGVGYRDYHGPRSHAFLADTFRMVQYFLHFHEDNAGVRLPHEGEEVEVEFGLIGCVEESYDPYGCEGDLIDSPWGLLCEGHGQWYTD